MTKFYKLLIGVSGLFLVAIGVGTATYFGIKKTTPNQQEPKLQQSLSGQWQIQLQKDLDILNTKKQYYNTKLQQLRSLKTNKEDLEQSINRYLNQELNSDQTFDLVDGQTKFQAIKSETDRLFNDLITSQQSNQQLVRAIQQRVNKLEKSNKQFDLKIKKLLTETSQNINQQTAQWQPFLNLQAAINNDLQLQINSLEQTIAKYNLLTQIANFYQSNAARYTDINNYFLIGTNFFDLSKTTTQTNQKLLKEENWNKILLPSFADKNPQQVVEQLERHLTNLEQIKASDQILKALDFNKLKEWQITNNFRKKPQNQQFKTKPNIPDNRHGQPSDWKIANGELQLVWLQREKLPPTNHSLNIDFLIDKQKQEWYENAIWLNDKTVEFYQGVAGKTTTTLTVVDFWSWIQKYFDWISDLKKDFDWLLSKLPQMKTLVSDSNWEQYLESESGSAYLKKGAVGLIFEYRDTFSGDFEAAAEGQEEEYAQIDLSVLEGATTFGTLNEAQLDKLIEFMNLNSKYQRIFELAFP